MVSIYGPPHPELLQASSQTLKSCRYQGDLALCVFNVKAIVGVVAMVPHTPFPGEAERYFVVEKPGIDMACLRGESELATEDSDI